MTTPKQGKKAAGSLILALILAALLVITSVALLFSMVSVDGNTFQMGRVKIELNGGQTIFNEASLVVEPGYSVVEDFTVENTGTADAYYRLYLENVSGSLKDILVFDLYDGDQLIFSGKASELTRQNPCSGGIVNTLTNGASTLWTNFSLLWGTRSVGIVNTLTNGASALWTNFAAVWGTRGVGIVNTLTNGASALWANFAAVWGTRGVGIVNTLTSAASTLWANFAAGWGTRSVGIVNTLVNSAASLWQQFRSGWAGRTLGLTVTYSTNVGAVKRAVYRALGLSGWPTISFAARGGVFRSATLTMLGEAGTEAVVPLENNTGWMDVMAEKLGERMGGAGTITIPVYIGGEKLAEAVVEAVNAETRRTGVSPLYL